MIATVGIKKSVGIEGIIGSHNPSPVDQSSRIITIEGTNQLTTALKLYEQILNDDKICCEDGFVRNWITEKNSRMKNVIHGTDNSYFIPHLTNQEINKFIGLVSIYKTEKNYLHCTAIVISALLNHCKNNEVTIDILPESMYFAIFLNNYKSITINDDIDQSIGLLSTFTDFIINGNVHGKLGNKGHSLSFDVFGKVELDNLKGPTFTADYSKYTFHKSVNLFKYSKYSIPTGLIWGHVDGTTYTFYDKLDGNIDIGKNCTYKTNNTETLEKLMETVMDSYSSNHQYISVGYSNKDCAPGMISSNNKIYFIEADDTEKLVWYSDDKIKVVQ